MKTTLEQIREGEEEIIIRYRSLSEEVQAVIAAVEKWDMRILGTSVDGNGQKILLNPKDIFYFESVDGVTYAYLENGVYRLGESLNDLLVQYISVGFIRCARTMIVNIYKMEKLKSETCGRIQATLTNGECILISRKYAVELRLRLRGCGE